MAHTKGPWEAQDGCVIHMLTGNKIAICVWAKDTEEWKGNARLIAAAPEMLDALKEIALGEGGYSTDRMTHAENTIEHMKAIAYAAIADVERDD